MAGIADLMAGLSAAHQFGELPFCEGNGNLLGVVREGLAFGPYCRQFE